MMDKFKLRLQKAREAKQGSYERKLVRDEEKRIHTQGFGMVVVKEEIREDTYCTNHWGCFRATFGKGESKEHRNKKYERWCYHRELGHVVFCEAIFKGSMGRADLIIVEQNGAVYIEEIVVSEKEDSLTSKQSKYPFIVNKIYVNRKI